MPPLCPDGVLVKREEFQCFHPDQHESGARPQLVGVHEEGLYSARVGQALCQQQPALFAQLVVGEVEKAEGGVEWKALYQLPHAFCFEPISRKPDFFQLGVFLDEIRIFDGGRLLRFHIRHVELLDVFVVNNVLDDIAQQLDAELVSREGYPLEVFFGEKCEEGGRAQLGYAHTIQPDGKDALILRHRVVEVCHATISNMNVLQYEVVNGRGGGEVVAQSFRVDGIDRKRGQIKHSTLVHFRYVKYGPSHHILRTLVEVHPLRHLLARVHAEVLFRPDHLHRIRPTVTRQHARVVPPFLSLWSSPL
mmetsp:Transcript_6467/g.16028  ORF Transcript_6467/g.16028 Transcript_6467/m.16028 type:complete len:306 (-) Transcript_6467:1260-2177(-)